MVSSGAGPGGLAGGRRLRQRLGKSVSPPGRAVTIGINVGAELKCQYHGWRYANRTAGCTYIPAHPANAPARTIEDNNFNGFERHGLIWGSIRAAARSAPSLDNWRPHATRAPAACLSRLQHPSVAKSLPRWSIAMVPVETVNTAAERMPKSRSSRSTRLRSEAWSRAGGFETAVMLFIQPVEQHRSIVHGIVLQARSGTASHGSSRSSQRGNDTDQGRGIEGSGQIALNLQRPATKYRREIPRTGRRPDVTEYSPSFVVHRRKADGRSPTLQARGATGNIFGIAEPVTIRVDDEHRVSGLLRAPPTHAPAMCWRTAPARYGASVHGGGRGRTRGARHRHAALSVSVYGARPKRPDTPTARPGPGARGGRGGVAPGAGAP